MKVGSTLWITALGVVAGLSKGAVAVRYAGWFGHRGVQMVDIIAMEGGYIVDGVNFTGGQFGAANVINQTAGVYLQLDLTKPFTSATDHEDIFSFRRDLVDGDQQNFVNGHMFHSNRSWFTFGGQPNKAKPSDSVNSVRRGSLPAYGASNIVDFYSGSLNTAVDGINGVHENISAAAYASSPDPGQKQGWLLGGMSRSDYSYMRYPLRTNDTILALDNFYQVDMNSEQQAYFKALVAPPNQLGARAQGGLVWLPFGNHGILLALGGVTIPADLFPVAPPALPTNNTFMSNLLVYDIDGQKWYNQTTLENDKRPTQLAGFCTAVVPTSDNFSQEIIVYGGSDGTGKGTASDDVWILSIPAFQWTHAISSNNAATHGRRGSTCFTPNPTTFLTIGGTKLGGSPLGSDTFIDVLDLNSMTWTGKYDPTANSSFSAPAALVSQLKWPDNKGPGNRAVANVNDPALSSLLNTAYPTAIKANYPYSSTIPSTSPKPTNTSTTTKPHHNIALIASLATIIPLLVIAAIIAFLCVRRRNRRKQGIQRTQNSRSNVSSWIRGTDSIDPHPEKSNASTDDTVVNSPSDYNVTPVIPNIPRKPHDIHQLHGSDTFTPPVHSPGLSSNAAGTHGQAYEIMTHEPRGIMSPASNTAGVSGHQSDVRSEMASDRQPASELPHNRSQEHLSPPSSGIAAGATSPSPISRKPVAERRESTPLPSPTTPNMGHARDTSDVSSAALTASPNTEIRRSQHIQGLPDHPALGHTSATQGRSSVYKEKFDDDK